MYFGYYNITYIFHYILLTYVFQVGKANFSNYLLFRLSHDEDTSCERILTKNKISCIIIITHFVNKRGDWMQSHNTSVISVFEAIAQLGEASRARISDMTGFSQVTVGKAVELLDSCGIITQHKSTSGTVGRKSGMCRIVKSNGMLIFDLTDTPNAGLYDITLSLCDEYSSTELADMTVQGLTRFSEILGGELMGIGCVMPDTDKTMYADGISDLIGITPELVITSNRAYAVANAKRFEYNGMAAFVRLKADGSADGALVYNNSLFTGAHGGAGEFSRLFSSREMLCEKITSLCLTLDPGLIHISCESKKECADLSVQLTESLQTLDTDKMPSVIVEPLVHCRSAMEGAAELLREKYILSKIPNNT